MNNTFELQTKINANKALDFADKAILNQIISYINNNKVFHATNEYLAECWGTNLTAIKRAIRTLKGYGIIQVSNARKKHQQGDKAWYNKRYITVDFNALNGFLDGQAKAVNTQLDINPETAPIAAETVQIAVEHDDEPIGGVFPEQNNEFTRALSASNDYMSSTSSFPYNHEAVLELIESDSMLNDILKRKIKNEEIIDEDWTRGFLENISSTTSYMVKYRAIISKYNQVAC